MQILLLFLLIYLLITIRSSDKSFGAEKYINAVVLTSTSVVVISELLSLFNLFSRMAITISWSLTSVIFTALLFTKYQRTVWTSLISNSYRLAIFNVKKNKFLYGITTLIILLLVFQGLTYPTNNYDSMVYHMPRIIHWIQNGSLAHYPTHIYRQLYQPPFSELVIGNVYLLSGSDFFSNCIQLFYLLSSLVVIGQIAKKSGLSKNHQLLAIVVALTTPSVLLETTTTKNDIVVGFFLMATVYYIWRYIEYKSWRNLVFIGLSAGIAVYTKGTAYIFLAPISLILLYIFIKKWKNGVNTLFLKGSSLIILIILINLGHYTRNYRLTGNILGVTESMKYQYRNEDIGLKGFTSTIIRNASLHLYLGETPLHDFIQNEVIKFHKFIRLDPADPRFTYTKDYVLGSKLAMEDTVPNFLHFLAFLLSIGLIALYTLRKKYPSKGILMILGIVIIQVLLFNSYLKWQPWHTRLHIPMFFLIAPIIVSGLRNIGKPIIKMAVGLMLIWAFVMIIFNFRRPLLHYDNLTSKITLSSPRLQKYSPTSLNTYKDVLAIKKILKSYGGTVGMIIGGNAYIYPLMADENKLNSIKFEDVNLQKNNVSKQIKRQIPFPKYIITDNNKLEKAGYRNKLYTQVYFGKQFSLLQRSETQNSKKKPS